MSKKHKEHKWDYRASVGWVVGLGIVGSILYIAITAPRIATADLESTAGLHYHPTLSIVVNNEPIAIPNGIGLAGPVHNPIHTHDEGGGMLHLEFDGKVKKSDITLGKFFDAWGKEWTPSSFMNLPLDATHTLTMRVDGEVSNEYRDLLMKDKQTIELIYR